VAVVEQHPGTVFVRVDDHAAGFFFTATTQGERDKGLIFAFGFGQFLDSVSRVGSFAEDEYSR
jgi:hypothetical protein